MTISIWWGEVASSWGIVWQKIGGFAPLLVGALVILIVGFILGAVIYLIADKVLRAAGLPTLFEAIRLEELLKKGGAGKDTVGIIASLLKWIVWVVSFLAAAAVLQLSVVSVFLDQVLSYLNTAVSAAAFLLLGVILAHFVEKVVVGLVKAAELSHSESTGAIVRYAVLLFTVIIVLIQLGVSGGYLQTIFTGLVAALAIGGGLALGLGGQGVAKEWLEKLRKELK